MIPPWEAEQQLKDVPVTELCGIAGGIGGFLAQHGVHLCGEMKQLPISVLARRFGNPGRRIWYMAQGQDPEQIKTVVPPPKSIGHGKVIPPNTRDLEVLQTYLLHMSEKVALRLRRHELKAMRFFIGLRTKDNWISNKLRSAMPIDDGRLIMALYRQVLHEQDALNAVMDCINLRYGEFTLAPARLLNRSSMPNVIAPAWKPHGHRQTV